MAPQQALEDVELHPITVAGSEITIPTAEAVRGKNLLLLDSAIHSGRMMSHCVAKVLKLEPATVTTYALAVKRCTSFVPTLWGVMTDEVDRPYFLLDSIPNNRLNAGSKHPQPPVHLRTLCKEHLAAPGIRSGIASIDRVTWSDRLFQMETNPGTLTYLLEEGSKIRGFLTIHQDRDSLAIAEVVVDDSVRGKGYGGVLIRFADTLARQGSCQRIHLNAIIDRVDTYKGFGYRRNSKPELVLDTEVYHPMEREVLYHQGRRHVDGSSVEIPSDSRP